MKWHYKGRINKKAMSFPRLYGKTSKYKSSALLNKQGKYLYLFSAVEQLVESGNEFNT